MSESTEQAGEADTYAMSEDLLNLLACPVTRSPLTREGDFLVAQKGGLRYPIEDNIPVLLPDKAQLPDDVQTMDEFRRKYAELIPND